MSIKTQLVDDLTNALKAGDSARVGVLRMVKADILKKEVELRSQKGRDHSLNDDETLEVLAGCAKQRRQSIEAFDKAGRDDLKQREEAELQVIESYLPPALSDEELRAIVEQAVQETGATEMRQMGAVMKEVMARVQGRADGRVISGLVKERLS